MTQMTRLKAAGLALALIGAAPAVVAQEKTMAGDGPAVEKEQPPAGSAPRDFTLPKVESYACATG